VNALEGKTAIVTGGGAGIGAAIALALAAAKAHICIIGRSPGALQSVVAKARSNGGIAKFYQADLGDAAELERVIAALVRDLERVDILVQNAAHHASGLIEEASVEDLDQHYRVNLRAPYALTRGLMPMLKAGRGQIVFINSSSGVAAKAASSQYDATKHGLKALADSLRGEVNAAGVRVLSLYLGQTASGMQSRNHEANALPYQPERLLQPDDVASIVVNSLCLPETAEITDIHVRPMRRPLTAAVPGKAD
jgi:NADP-dependent 3-hydroxy acid dehydrogenase YdfG